MICPKCNNSIGDSECICGNCGYNVRDDVDVALMQCISISGKDIYNNSNKFNALIADGLKNCFHSILRDTLCLLKIIKGGLCSIGDLV